MTLQFICAEIERLRLQIRRQQKEVFTLQRSGIGAASAELLLARMQASVDALCIQVVEGGDNSALVLNTETGDTRENILARSEMLSHATHLVVAPKKRRAAIEYSQRGAKAPTIAVAIEGVLREHYPNLSNIGFNFAPVIRKTL